MNRGKRMALPSRVVAKVLRGVLIIPYIRYSVISIKVLHLYLYFQRRTLPAYTDASPTKLLYLSPKDIEYYFDSPPAVRFDDERTSSVSTPTDYGGVFGGTWDQSGIQFEKTTLYASMQERYQSGLDWVETELFTALADDIQRGIPRYECMTISELEAHFELVDRLYSSIEQEGYKSQRELFSDGSGWEDNTSRYDSVHPFLNEIAINIGRHGEMGKVSSGDHRLAIAKLLDIDEIPVIVRVRHEDWQRKRDLARELDDQESMPNEVKDYRDHPDLADVLGD